MNAIIRTVTVTMCYGQRMNDNMEFVDFCEPLIKDTDCAGATRSFRRLYHDRSITINHVEKETGRYRLSPEDFLKYATQID